MRQHQICHQQEIAQVLRKYAADLTIFLELLPQNKEYLCQCIIKKLLQSDLKVLGYISSIFFRDKTDGTQHCTKNEVFH